MTDLHPTPHTTVRNTDPGTSHAAARRPRRVPAIRTGILDVLSDRIPRTHDQIVSEYTRRAPYHGYPRAGASSIRTRTKELVVDGLVERLDRTRTARSNLNNPAGLYRAVTVHPDSTEDQNR